VSAQPIPPTAPDSSALAPPPAPIAGPNWGLIVLGTLLAIVSAGELAHFWGLNVVDESWLTPETLTAVGVALLGLGLVGVVMGRRRR